MTVDTITLTARRVLRRLTHARREAIEVEHQFLEADRSICPELWDLYHEESRFRSTSCTTEDRFLLAVARRFDLDPDMLDAAVLEADWEEQGRMAARSIASAGVCAYHLRGLECRNAPMNALGTCGCRASRNPLRLRPSDPDTCACTPEAAMR